MELRILAVAEAGPGGIDHRSAAAAGLAQRFAQEARGEADLVVAGGMAPVPGKWRRAWRTPACDGPGLTEALAAHLGSERYTAVLIGDTPLGREAAGRVSLRLGLPVVASVLGLRLQGEVVQASRPAAGGTRTATFALLARPGLIVVNPEAAGNAATGTDVATEAEELRAGNVDGRVALLDESRLLPWEMDLNEADAVVAGGRGVGGREGFDMLAELAGLLGGTVGASRVAVDAGWAPFPRQVGLTGRTVSPRLYIACGISGAIHHTMGMRNSSFVVAINSDARAPIFKIANVSIVGDVREVVPQMIAEIRSRKAKGVAAGARR